MKKASITEAKNNLSALIDSVKGGSSVLIMDRGRPVARLEPVSGGRPDDDSRLARLVREGIVRPARRGVAKELLATKPERLKQVANAWHEVDPSDPVREAAVRFLRVHPLRAADALQLAAAFIAAERRPSSLEVVTLDDRLAVAARKEGFVLSEALSA